MKDGREFAGKDPLGVLEAMRVEAMQMGAFPAPDQPYTTLLGKPHRGESLGEFINYVVSCHERDNGIKVHSGDAIDCLTKSALYLNALIRSGAAEDR